MEDRDTVEQVNWISQADPREPRLDRDDQQTEKNDTGTEDQIEEFEAKEAGRNHSVAGALQYHSGCTKQNRTISFTKQ